MSRNDEILEKFVAYCKENPEQRFWQALRNFSGWGFILATDDADAKTYANDTFYWEGIGG